MVFGAVGTGVATVAGKEIVISLLKLILGVNISVSIISGTTAATLTSSLGAAFHAAVINKVTNFEEPSLERIRKYMSEHK